MNNQRWTDDQFFKARQEVLALWPTGKEIDLEEAAEFLKGLPPEKNYAREIVRAKEDGRTLVQPRGGVALVDDHIALLKWLQDEGGADLLPNTTDTYTRNLKFKDAQRGIEESRNAG
ncbi:MAG TPA: methylaspartate mutase subunit E, partial [Thermodesulfobacteriota bacterium]|nr:methylaspartate mutase subunit E [Thermodesulfobacteriota bacterium]